MRPKRILLVWDNKNIKINGGITEGTTVDIYTMDSNFKWICGILYSQSELVQHFHLNCKAYVHLL